MDDNKLEESIIKVILIVILCANFFGAIELYSTNRTRFYISVLPTLVSQIMLLVFNRKIKAEMIATTLGFLLIYTSVTTSLFADISQDYNSPLIPIMMGIILVGVFSYNRKFTLSIILVSIFSIAYYCYRRTPELEKPIEVYIAYSLHLLVISLIAFSTTIMNYKRYIYQLQIESSNKRMIAGEKLRGSEIIMPAISHDISGPLGNAKILSDVILNELKEGKYEGAEHILDSVELLHRSLARISKVVTRYRNLTLPKNPSRNSYQLKEIVEQVEKYLKLITPDLKDVDIDCNENLYVINGISLIPVFKDILENSISHNPNKGLKIKISCKCTKNSLAVRVSDNGTGFINSKKYLENPVLSSFNGVSRTSLGLYLSRLRVEHAFGGEIEIKSSSDGTEVSIIIPDKFIDRAIS